MRWVLAIVPIAIGCGGYTIPQETVNAPRVAIASAEGSGAERTPTAARRLELARGELATANKLAKQGKTRRADLVYQRAEADARVAQAVALDSTVSAQARAIDEQISALRGALPESP